MDHAGLAEEDHSQAVHHGLGRRSHAGLCFGRPGDSMITKLKTLLFRLPLAFLLAALVIPIGNLLSPDTLFAGRTQVPAAVDASVQEHLDQLAKHYGIDAPIHRFTSMRFAAVTSRSALPEDGGKVVIGLGKPIQKQSYFDHPEWLKAAVGHEFGHALMMARGQSFSELPIFGMYALAFVPILLVFPTRRGRLSAAAALALGITDSWPCNLVASSMTPSCR